MRLQNISSLFNPVIQLIFPLLRPLSLPTGDQTGRTKQLVFQMVNQALVEHPYFSKAFPRKLPFYWYPRTWKSLLKEEQGLQK